MKRILLTLFCINSLFLAAQLPDYKKAPNSYIYDINLAKTNNYGGILVPVKKAYDMWSGYQYLKTNGVGTPIPPGAQSASLVWEDVPGLISNLTLEKGSLPENSKIKIIVDPGKGKGNAVVALKVDGTTYWSWHIWVTDNPENGVSYSQGFETDNSLVPFSVQYMDRNLGAVGNHFIGSNWDKTAGLMYEWGRKDPFPTLVNKDSFFYELNGEAGNLKHKSIDRINTIPVKLRQFNEIEKNIQESVKNPLTYIINSDATGQWFSSSRYRVTGATTAENVAWDLWSDNAKGTNGNVSSSNVTLRNETRSYELKSELDPCPNGWRVPSHYGRVTVNNNHSPWGRKNSGVNDDTSEYSKVKPDIDNAALTGIKVYPGLGMDFTNAQNGARNLGIVPINGGYVYYPNAVSPNAEPGVIYQDQNANGNFWSATYSSDGARVFSLISDHARTTTSVGLHAVYINQTNPTKSGNAVRCMKDPNLAKIGNFQTEYFVSQKQNYTTGLHQPNSYIIKQETEIRIPVSKAFSVYNQYLSDQEMLPEDQLVAKVLWTTNPNIIKNIQILKNTADLKNSEIVVKLDPNQKGNAVVSLHNGDTKNPAYWSWHIWIPQNDPSVNTISYTTEQPIATLYNFVNPTVSKVPPITSEFMDRNLGAVDKLQTSGTTENAFAAKGLHYQWGRKDPIPAFPSNEFGMETKIYLGSENASETGTITYTEQTKLGYESAQTVPYITYGSQNVKKALKLKENLKFSVQNPLKFLYQSGLGNVFDGGNKANNNLSLVKDWASNERSQLPNRWGHADKKSVFDPCPSGWRVPDVNFTNLYTSSKGNSPWYNSYNNDAYGKPGVIQDQWHAVNTYYQGVSSTNGWTFEGTTYKIGSFAKDGIRGEIGDNKINYEKAGVWTASLADLATGYGIAMQFEGSRMQTGTGVYPQAAMGVRCMKDNNAEMPFSKGTGTLATVNVSNERNLLYPNPFHSEIKVDLIKAEDFEIYDISGKLFKKGKIQNEKIEASNLQQGVYIIRVILKDGTVVSKKMIKI